MNLDEYAAACGRLGTTDLSRHTDTEISAWLDELMVGAGTLHVLERTFNQTWWRGRLCDSAEGFAGLHECIYRPAGSIHDYGRAHMRHGESVFYASWNLPTVIRELAPVPGQFVQIIAVRPWRPITCHTVGEMTHFFNSGGSLVNSPKMIGEIDNRFRSEPPDEFMKSRLFDAFLINQFRTPDDRRYRLTALFAKK